MKELKILIYLGKKGALRKKIKITTKEIGNELKTPQQTVSRILTKLTNNGLITKEDGIRGILVSVTQKGKQLLSELNLDINEVFVKEKEFKIKGRVIDGLKDGKYYLGLDEYSKKIKNKVGFKPFPGTLNIMLDEEESKEKLQKMNGIEIEGFKKDDRVFGSIKSFKCKINDADAIIVIPERSHYGSNILEIISQFELRKKLNLKNGDEVIVEVIK
jgi:riboflavin kinase